MSEYKLKGFWILSQEITELRIVCVLIVKKGKFASGYAALEYDIRSYFCGMEYCLYPMDFKMHRDGKGANPWEHR
ncbi:conserved hypothetical protein [Photorhabdus asymbiotica]|uniref:Uncharacterized protein n=1 Tax=Photorhabdus asymbiotica subsp. asymbiotica (strain ATCC 43949 / 3105-77) TaxID=553480 RepID=C7BT26_PHOAA|nr:conserved hypothetical protein [Photorhabdus asymbiotica]